VSSAGDDPPVADNAGYWRQWLAILLVLCWICAAAVAFVTDTSKPHGPADEPATWKLVVWLILFVAGVPAVLLLSRLS
jgi:hypothetical protein